MKTLAQVFSLLIKATASFFIYFFYYQITFGGLINIRSDFCVVYFFFWCSGLKFWHYLESWWHCCSWLVSFIFWLSCKVASVTSEFCNHIFNTLEIFRDEKQLNKSFQQRQKQCFSHKTWCMKAKCELPCYFIIYEFEQKTLIIISQANIYIYLNWEFRLFSSWRNCLYITFVLFRKWNSYMLKMFESNVLIYLWMFYFA